MPSTSVNFDGASASGYIPPDPNGAAGTTQYMEVTNIKLAVYSKTGAVLIPPESTNTLWAGFGGPCETVNGGDATVVWDALAQRWVVQQLAFASTSTPPYLDCIAVSSSSDATGTWHRASFAYSKFPDYPKLGVWPDAYYISYNMFNGGFVGAEVCAIDRAKLLTGEAPTEQCRTDASGAGTLQPATIDGSTPPPPGQAEWLVALSATEANALAYWRFHVDWTNPANTTFTGPTNLAVQPFSQPCVGYTRLACIPQAETSTKLASLGDRLMYRLAYRNLGGHEAMVVDHAVTTSGGVGMRWYELRPSGESLSVYQQGTYAPDSTYRWMGSVAMDRAGDIALGYSASDSSLHPGIRYTGRLERDPPGTMPQGEATLYSGTGSQTGGYVRWGDYTEMSVDPSDECTFWYVNEYLPNNGSFNWHTRIGAFQFPSCISEPPAVNNEPATSITQTAAVLHGHVDNEGAAGGASCKFVVALQGSPETAIAEPACEPNLVTGSALTAVQANVDELEPNTEYVYRVVAENSGGATTGAPDQKFATLPEPPSVSNDPATSVAQTAAVLHGHVDNEGAAGGASCKFVVALQSSPGTAVAEPACEQPNLVTGNTPTAVQANADGLESNTEYVYRVMAGNGGGTTTGTPDQKFATLPEPPSVSNDPATSITQTAAVLHGHVDNEGAAGGASCKFVVALQGSPETAVAEPACEQPNLVTGNTPTAVQANAYGLESNTEYVYRVVAGNEGGHTTASPYGELKTQPMPPSAAFSVSTASPTAAHSVGFDAASVKDPDGTISSYSWYFGDGTHASGVTTSHIYARAGEYSVSLEVVDSNGLRDISQRVIDVKHAPNAFGIRRLSADCTGRIVLAIQVPGPGVLRARARSIAGQHSKAAQKLRSARRQRKTCQAMQRNIRLIQRSRVHHHGKSFRFGASSMDTQSAGTVRLVIWPNRLATRRILMLPQNRLRVRIAITFNPYGGTARAKHLMVLVRGLVHRGRR